MSEFGTFKESTQKMWGKFKAEAIDTFTDPVKVGAIVVNAASSAAISYGIEKFLLKGIEWKYKWLGFKTANVPVINAKVPYPAIVDKKLVLVPKMGGAPINELKRNLVAGAAGTIISGFWTVPIYLKVDKDIGKAMAIGSGLNMLGWIIKGGVQYAKASMDYKKKVKAPVKKAKKGVKKADASYSDYTFYAGATKNYRPLTPQSPYPASSTRNPTDVIWEQYQQPEDSPGMQQEYVWPPNKEPYANQVPYYDEPMYDPIDFVRYQGEEVGKHHHGGGRGWGPGPYYPEPIYVETEEVEAKPQQPQVIIVKQEPWWASGLGEQGKEWLSEGDTDGEGVEGDMEGWHTQNYKFPPSPVGESDGIITYNGAHKKKKGKKDIDAQIEKLDEDQSEMLQEDGIAAEYD